MAVQKTAILLILSLFLFLGPAPATEDPRPLIIDTDMATDDMRALFALLGDEDLSIQAVATVEGSTSLGKGTSFALSLMAASGVQGIPVYRGAAVPGLKAPAWRRTADQLGASLFTLGGKEQPFPGVTPKLHEIITGRNGGVHYLALGPLGNLARLEAAHPGTLAQIHTLWIPVIWEGPDRCLAWNLTWDAASTEEVFRKARRLMLVDVSPFRAMNGLAFLEGISGEGHGAEWIEGSLAVLRDQGGHVFLYDELAAAAVMQPGLMSEQGVPFSLERVEKDRLVFTKNPEGPVRLASFKENQAALDLLKSHWSMHLSGHRASGHEVSLHLSDKDLLVLYHGHLGPYVALGYRMGRHALDTLQAEGHFDVSAKVYAGKAPPPSCLLDGVQISSGCTLGKKNIEAIDHDGAPYGIFTNRRGKEVTLRVRPEIPELIGKMIGVKGLEPAAEFLLAAEAESLFEVEVVYKKGEH